MKRFFLMHKDIVCGSLIFDEQTGRVMGYKDAGNGYAPYLGNSESAKIKKWWEMRAIPASRVTINEILKRTNSLNTETYLAKNLALSMTDTYWICPADAPLTYDEVKFSNLGGWTGGKVPYHNATSYDYNASLGGQMEKYWDLGQEIPMLIKESSRFYGQQSVNEVFATKLHDMQGTDIPYVRYTAEATSGNGIISRCSAFTSDSVEFISAYEMVESAKSPNDISVYDHYVKTCVKNGIDNSVIRNFMDYQTMTDFVISNTDEHLNNFGVLRNTDTMKLIGPAPIFDSGNSMFYLDGGAVPYTRALLLAQPITSFYKRYEQMLAKVENKNLVKVDLLPTGEMVKELYVGAGIPEEKAEFISCNYESKVQMLDEFQHGKKLSLYQEKQNEQKHQQMKQGEKSGPSFIMMCGIPGTGKSGMAKSIVDERIRGGEKYMDACSFYSVETAAFDTQYILHRTRVLNQLTPNTEFKNSVTLISANAIREEMQAHLIQPNNQAVFLTAQARTRAALISGATVVYDASNVDRNQREDFLRLALSAGAKSTELYITDSEKRIYTPSIPENRVQFMKNKLFAEYPSKDEGWDKIQDANPRQMFQSAPSRRNDEWER